MNEFAELCEDLVLSFRPLFVVELGESAFLVSAVYLVLLAKTDGLHTTMSATRHNNNNGRNGSCLTWLATS